MTRAIPGHKQVVEMAQAGTTPSEIARITGLSIHTVGYDLYTARKAGVDIPKFTKGRTRKLGHDVRIPLIAINALESEAIRRGLTVNHLAGMILTRIAENNQVGAVLDDGGRNG